MKMRLAFTAASWHFMRSRSSIEIRRCRPLLGTFVEITARGGDERLLARGIEAGFDTVAQVNRLMSFHDPMSDVSRMNREAFPKGVSVHPWTWQSGKRIGFSECFRRFNRHWLRSLLRRWRNAA